MGNKKIVKFNDVVASRIIELSSLGYSPTEVSKLLNVSRTTLWRWIKRHDLEERMQLAESDMMKGAIKRGLVALSEGAKSTDMTKEYVSEENGQIVKVTEKIRTLAPNEKAIQILSQKYDKVFSQAEITDDSNNSKVSININTSAMTIRELQAIPSPLGAIGTASDMPIETYARPVPSSETVSEEVDSELTPPASGSE